MPVTRTAVIAHVVIKLEFDMIASEAKATIRRLIDGEQDGEDTPFTAAGADFAALLSMPGVQGMTLADQITNGAYAYLISKGQIAGEIS